ncbi:MAG: metallophosphatase domain-containing protein [Lacunisphaera sp.]|nr:metallophosphatase domain-containing protein [Lacunisphaera sp.]
MRIVCIADTHGRHHGLEIPDGDILIHAGDISGQGSPDEITDFLRWFSALPHEHKVFVSGNHDWLFEREPEYAATLIPAGVTYLQDSGCDIAGLKIWGSPVTPAFYDWAFNRGRGEEIRKHWQLIPPGTDIVVSHGPASGIMDRSLQGKPQGCADLLQRLGEVQPRLHVCGHIHSGYGKASLNGTIMVNASICNEAYYPSNAPLVVEL